MRRTLLYPIAVLLATGARPLLASYCTFSDFLPCAQNILLQTAPEQCDNENLVQRVDSLCSDTTWLKDSARKIQGSCGCAGVDNFADTTIINCGSVETSSALSADEIIAAGGCSPADGGSSSAAPAPSNAVSGNGPSGASNDGNAPPANTKTTSKGSSSNDSPESDRIALGVGIGVGVPTTILTAVGIWLQCVRRRS